MTNLLDGHDNLDSVETVEAEIVVEVRLAVELCIIRISDPSY